MIIRIFVALLALNMIAFVVRAEAGERVFADEMPAEDIYQLQDQMSGDFESDDVDMYANLGSRLLSLGFSGSDTRSRSYASDPARADHGIALLEEGACLNLKWNF
ncbi:hypothetical protein DIT71_11995 [Marinobacter vulgaris]|uniref:Uncharacterized protein n=1 Tax=Marinobacter vulgaris TaxID=1928331 RepID=A0A2V3ZIS6_9GAMM|nr:hypothetical protein [Marinobacter vulgaris]PXX90220.1 hypothetical protein DIT71_11995 [Marinobacter vulgaris]TSJ69756.1 hypothetical protein FPC41_12650 [Marinobacter vulgaris]